MVRTPANLSKLQQIQVQQILNEEFCINKGSKPLTIIAKLSISDVREGPYYASTSITKVLHFHHTVLNVIKLTHFSPMSHFYTSWKRQKAFVRKKNIKCLEERVHLSKSSSPNFTSNIEGLLNFYSPWNHQKTGRFLMISGGIEIN